MLLESLVLYTVPCLVVTRATSWNVPSLVFDYVKELCHFVVERSLISNLEFILCCLQERQRHPSVVLKEAVGTIYNCAPGSRVRLLITEHLPDIAKPLFK